jgi:hypothetical protein
MSNVICFHYSNTTSYQMSGISHKNQDIFSPKHIHGMFSGMLKHNNLFMETGIITKRPSFPWIITLTTNLSSRSGPFIFCGWSQCFFLSTLTHTGPSLCNCCKRWCSLWLILWRLPSLPLLFRNTSHIATVCHGFLVCTSRLTLTSSNCISCTTFLRRQGWGRG